MKFYMNKTFHLPEDQAVDPYVARHFKRNFIVNFLDIAIYFFGDSFATAYTILPVFVSTLTDSPIIIGLIPAIYEAGWFIPQLFFAPYVQRQSKLMPLVVRLATMERSSYLFLALGAFALPFLKKELALGVILLLIVWKSVSAGFFGLPWQELLAKVIPVSHRGRFYGGANMLGKILGILGAVVTGLLLDRLPYPRNFGVVFSLGFAGVMVSMVFFLMTKEPKNHVPEPVETPSLQWRVKVLAILKSDRDFRNFLISRALSFLGYMAFAFMAVYGIEKYNLPDSYSAVFTGILIAFNVIGFALMGHLGDKYGNKRVFVLSDILLILSLITALVWQSLPGLYLMFALVSLSQAGAVIGDMNMVLEFGSVEDRPTYIGLSKTLTGPVFLLAPVIGGGVVSHSGYPAMFLVSLGFALLAFLFLVFFVVEPRERNL